MTKPEALGISILPRDPSSRKVAGEVFLDLDLARSEGITKVRVKCRAGASANIRYNAGEFANVASSNIEILRLDQDLWTPSDANSYSNHKTASFPFTFTLDDNAQIPSFSKQSHTYTPAGEKVRTDDSGTTGEVFYFVEAVAEREGKLNKRRRARQDFTFIPTHPYQPPDLPELLTRWQGKYKFYDTVKTLKKKKFFGDTAEMTARIMLPSIELYPTGVAIPIKFVITTLSKEYRSSTDVPDEQLFPSLPDSPQSICLEARSRRIVMAGDRKREDWFSIVPVPGFWKTAPLEDGSLHPGFGTSSNPPPFSQNGSAVSSLEKGHSMNGTSTSAIGDTPSKYRAGGWDSYEKTWIPLVSSSQGQGPGQWKRELKYSTHIIFNTLPTFNSSCVAVEHFISLSYLLNKRDVDALCGITLFAGKA